jgi:hypothetical protein
VSVEAKPIARYRRRAYTWDALQYDGANAADVIAFVGGPDYAVVEDDRIVLSLQGKNVQSQKLTVMPMQWVLIPFRGGPFNVVSDGEFNMVFEEDTGPQVQPL